MNKVIERSLMKLLAVCLLCAAALLVPSAALASSGASADVKILLGFKERYGSENKQHLGIDVYSPKGTKLKTPVEGVVSFVGRVPGSAGLNVSAVTVKTKDGELVSLNPFDEVKVKKGDGVVVGQVLGTVSDVGDPSSPESHYHLSLRVNGSYRDPKHLLTAGISDRESNQTLTVLPGGAMGNPADKGVGVNSPTKAPAGETALQSTGERVGKGALNNVSSATSKAGANSAAIKSGKNISSTGDKKDSLSEVTKGSVNQPASQEKDVINRLAQAEKGQGNTISQKAATLSEEKRNPAPSANSKPKIEVDAKLNTGYFLGGTAAPHREGTNLEGERSSSKQEGVGLRAEIYSQISKMSQVQLVVSLAIVLALLSCAGMGIWRTAQLMGVHSALSEGCDHLQKVMGSQLAKGERPT